MAIGGAGKVWQDALDRQHRLYERRGEALIFETPPAVSVLHMYRSPRSLRGWKEAVNRLLKPGQFVGLFKGEGPPDFVGLAGGLPVVAEAKSCLRGRWPFAKLADHQAARLDAWERHGGVGLILLYHSDEARSWAVLWRDLRPMWRRWRSSASDPETRARSGTASLSVAQLDGGIGLRINGTDWLGAVIEDLRRSREE